MCQSASSATGQDSAGRTILSQVGADSSVEYCRLRPQRHQLRCSDHCCESNQPHSVDEHSAIRTTQRYAAFRSDSDSNGRRQVVCGQRRCKQSQYHAVDNRHGSVRGADYNAARPLLRQRHFAGDKCSAHAAVHFLEAFT